MSIMENCSSALSKAFLPVFLERKTIPRTFKRKEFHIGMCSTLPSFSDEPHAASSLRVKETKGRPSSHSIRRLLCDKLEHAVDEHFSQYPPGKSLDPDLLLVGNFAPVDELPPMPCPIVKGSIPECLRGGAYLRNGPNPRQHPRGAHHIFDGEGMLHSLLLPVDDADGSHAILCSRYCRTTAPLISKTFGLRGLEGTARFIIAVLRILSRQMDRIEGLGPSSTSVSFFWDNVFVHGETDRPFAVYLSPESGDLLLPARRELGRRLPNGMSVHYKHDKGTGDLYALSYGILPPFLTYHCYDSQGNTKLKLPIWSALRPSVFHDFAITKRYAIIPETQMVLDPLGMAFCNGSFVTWDAKRIPRVGVMPRDASSGVEIRWFDVPGFNPTHICNAWEEGDDGEVVVLVASSFVSGEHLLTKVELVHTYMEMVRIDLKNSTVVRTVLSAMGLGFDSVHPAYRGRKSRYAYAAIVTEPPKISGVAKIDLELAAKRMDCVIATREFGPGVFCGEPFFVSKGEEDELDEDDGYLMTFIHDEEEEMSTFVVVDAKTPELEVVAEVELPQRVPYGFHGVFVESK